MTSYLWRSLFRSSAHVRHVGLSARALQQSRAFRLSCGLSLEHETDCAGCKWRIVEEMKAEVSAQHCFVFLCHETLSLSHANATRQKQNQTKQTNKKYSLFGCGIILFNKKLSMYFPHARARKHTYTIYIRYIEVGEWGDRERKTSKLKPRFILKKTEVKGEPEKSTQIKGTIFMLASICVGLGLKVL